MAFKYRQKKTIRRKRRFLKRKSAKTYRRSLTKRRSMRGGEENWNVKVKYVEYNRDQTFDDDTSGIEELDKAFGNEKVEKEGDGSFKIVDLSENDRVNMPSDNAVYGVLTLLNIQEAPKIIWWYPKAENSTEFIPHIGSGEGGFFIPGKDVGTTIRQGDRRVVSFEKMPPSG